MPISQLRLLAVLLCLSPVLSPLLSAQDGMLPGGHLDQERSHQMLRIARYEVRKNYYDPTLHGIDLDARFNIFDSALEKAQNVGAMFTLIAQFLDGFNDSHLFFEPPPRLSRYDPDFRMLAIGERCFVTDVRPNSRTAALLHPGDRIIKLDGIPLTRRTIADAEYSSRLLVPRTDDKLDVVSPDGVARSVNVPRRLVKEREYVNLNWRLNQAEYWNILRRGEDAANIAHERVSKSDSALIWKVSYFGFQGDKLGATIDDAKKRPALILDLRGNPGGAIEALQGLIAQLFDHDVKIADRVMRKPGKPAIARHAMLTGKPFTGKLIVLVDSASGSSSELLARVVQLEHRGIVIGDQTAGAVTEANNYSETIGATNQIFYGFSIPHANLIMADGKSLEGTGVTPDEVVQPTPADLAAGRDPALARAAELAGWTMSTDAAGRLFPYEWSPE